MNRGHALQRAGELTAAVAAYAQAIALLRELPVTQNSSWANSLGAACMNHGQLLHRAHGIARAEEALVSFAGAISVLRQLPATENPWPRRNLAGSHLNRASLLLDLARPQEARTDALAALQLAMPCELADPVGAELALKARRALCDALGQLVVTPGADQDDLARQASDLVDDGLGLIRHWRVRGGVFSRPLALRLFRFGTRLYRLHQPHFLVEFIEENLSLSPDEFTPIALEAIASALALRPADRPFLIMGDPFTENRLRLERELVALRTRLTA